MNTDKELLELAAKAANYVVEYRTEWWNEEDLHLNGMFWNPLTDDGDALRLAVKLNIFYDPQFIHERDVLMFTKNIEKQEATRRAIVRVAAEIGKTL